VSVVAGAPGRSDRRGRWLALAAALPLGLALISCGQTGTPGGSPAAIKPAPPGEPAAPGEQPPPPPVPSPDGPTGQPRLEFAAVRHDFGKIIDAGKYTAEFPFTNTGDGTLVIGTLKTDCACTTTQLEKTEFLPGEGSAIKVEFHPLKPGPQERQVRVFSNARPNMTILYLAADVETLVQLRGAQVVPFGTLKLGLEHKRTFNVDYTVRDLVFEDFAVNSPHVEARLVQSGQPVPDVGYRATIEVIIKPTAPWGLLYPLNLTFTARRRGPEPLEKSYTVFISAELFNDLRARAEIFASRESAPGAAFTTGESISEGQLYRAVLLLERLSGTPFAVTGANVERSTMPGMTVAVEPVTPASYRLTLSGDTTGSFGAFEGMVKVTTDVPGEEVLAIPFNGYIK
jgi:hypothetical protein